MPFLDIDPNCPAPEALAHVAAVLTSGGLVVCPTETRYGLICRVDNLAAVDRLFAVKGRSANAATALFVNDIRALERLAILNDPARKLADLFLPGSLTLVLKALVDWPAPLVVDGRIGIRISPSPLIAALLERIGAPLTATSANRTGAPTRATAHRIEEELGGKWTFIWRPEFSMVRSQLLLIARLERYIFFGKAPCLPSTSAGRLAKRNNSE